MINEVTSILKHYWFDWQYPCRDDNRDLLAILPAYIPLHVGFKACVRQCCYYPLGPNMHGFRKNHELEDIYSKFTCKGGPMSSDELLNNFRHSYGRCCFQRIVSLFIEALFNQPTFFKPRHPLLGFPKNRDSNIPSRITCVDVLEAYRNIVHKTMSQCLQQVAFIGNCNFFWENGEN